jgi:hypothetical protein
MLYESNKENPFPFKGNLAVGSRGKVRMGMGDYFDRVETHPHPIPPLEGEGVLRPSKLTCELIRNILD